MIAKTYSTATSGTVTLLNTKQDQIVVHDAASLAATLTVTMPANPIDGQYVSFASTLGVTVLTISSALTIVGTLTTLAAAGYWTLCYESTANKWFRIG
jgi:hypothetical protein